MSSPKIPFLEIRKLHTQGKEKEAFERLDNIINSSSEANIELEASIWKQHFKFTQYAILKNKTDFEKLVSKSKQLESKRCLALSNLGLAKANEYLSQFQTALNLCKIVLNEQIRFQDIDVRILGLHISSRILWRMGRYSESLFRTEKALMLRIMNGFDFEVAASYNNIAVNFLVVGDLTEALNYSFKALITANNENNLYQKAPALNNIACIYRTLGKLNRALKFFEASLNIKRKIKDKYGYAISLVNIAQLRSLSGNLRETIHLLEQVKMLREDLDDEIGLAHVLINLSIHYFEQGKINLSLELIDRAINISRRLNRNIYLARALAQQSKLYIDLDYLNEAAEGLKEALGLLKREQSNFWLVEPLLDYAKVEFYLGDVEDAKRKLEQAYSVAQKNSSIREVLLCKLIEATFLKEEENLGDAKKLLKEVYEESKRLNLANLAVESQIILAEIALISYRIDRDETAYSQVQEKIQTIIKISRVERRIPQLIDVLATSALINLGKGRFENAMRDIKEALGLAQKNNLVVKEIRALRIKQTIEERKQISSQFLEEYNDIFERNDMIKAIQLLQDSKTRILLDPTDIYLVAFKYKLNEIEVIAENVPEEFSSSENLAVDLGAFYMLAIGQGDNYHSGLFGPLPVALKEDYSSMIYATTIVDKSQKDHRMTEQTYILICLLYPSSKAEFFTDLRLINSIFEDEIKTKIQDVSQIDRFVLRRLREKIYALSRRQSD